MSSSSRNQLPMSTVTAPDPGLENHSNHHNQNNSKNTRKNENKKETEESSSITLDECESKIHQAVVDAILRSPPGAFRQVGQYLAKKREQEQQQQQKEVEENDQNENENQGEEEEQEPSLPKYLYEDVEALFLALNPKYNIVSFSTLAKLLSLSAEMKYRCDESDARDLVLSALEAEVDTPSTTNPDQGGEDNSQQQQQQQQTLAHGGVTFEQFCLIGDALRENMFAASNFGCHMSEHDKCLSLQHKIMETISTNKLQEKAKQQHQQNNNNGRSSASSPLSSPSSPKSGSGSNNNYRRHKLQWYEISFLKEAHTESLLQRPDSDKKTASYRQAPLFKSPNNHNSVVLVPRHSYPTHNNSSSSHYHQNQNHLASSSGTTPTSPQHYHHHHHHDYHCEHHHRNHHNDESFNNNNNDNENVDYVDNDDYYIQVSTYRPPTQERKLPRSHARSTISSWYDGRKVATMPMSSNVRHVYSARGRREMQKNKIKKSQLESHAEEDTLLLQKLGDSLM